MGRGGGAVTRPGNIWYRSLVDKYRHEYVSRAHNDKRGLMELVLFEVADKGGRFLERIECAHGTLKDTYREVPRKRAMEKTGQALRELRKSAVKGQASLANGNSSQAQSSIRPTITLKSTSAASVKSEPSVSTKKRKSRSPCSALVMPITAPSCGKIEIETKPRVLPKRAAKTKSIKEIAKQLFAERSSSCDDDHAKLASPAKEDLLLDKDETLSSPLHTMAKAAEMHSQVLAEATTPAESVSRSLECKTPAKAGLQSFDNAKKMPLVRPSQFFNNPSPLLTKPMAKLVSIGSDGAYSGVHPQSESKREMAILHTPHEIDTPRDWSFYTPSSANKVLCFQSPTPPGAKAANFIPSSQDSECASVDLSCLEGCDCGDHTMSPIPLSHITTTTTRHPYHAAVGSCARRVSDASHPHDDMDNNHNNSHAHSWDFFDFCLRSGTYP